jgi:hypothetical protein
MLPSTSRLPVSDEEIIETVHRMLSAGEKHEAASLLRKCRARFEQTGYDNWDGGTYTITLYIQVAPETFTLLEARREDIEREITETLMLAVKQMSRDWYVAGIVPLIVGMRGRPDLQGNPLSKRVKRSIIAHLKSEQIVWHGMLTPPEFLDPLYELDKLPSTDSRFKDANGDIWQHTVNNDDWPLEWIFQDDRFNLLSGSDSTFLAFLERCLDPAVRLSAEAEGLAVIFNNALREDGWNLGTMELMGDEEKYRVGPWNPAYGRAAESLQKTALILSSTWMYQEIQRIEASINTDPALAIGTAKELVDTCCKHIADRLSLPLPKKPDTPDLVRAVLEGLKLLPEDISDAAKGVDSIRKMLRALTTLMQGLVEVRNIYGTGHGKSSKHKGPQPRHARLAVASAATFVEFIVETYRDRDRKGMGDQVS